MDQEEEYVVDTVTGEGRWVAVGTGNVPLAPPPPPGVRADSSCLQSQFVHVACGCRAPQCHLVRQVASRISHIPGA